MMPDLQEPLIIPYDKPWSEDWFLPEEETDMNRAQAVNIMLSADDYFEDEDQ